MNYLVGVYDLKSEGYCFVQCVDSIMNAKQNFVRICTSKQDSFIAQFKNDFQLVLLGKFDLDSGMYYEDHKVLLHGSDIQVDEEEK